MKRKITAQSMQAFKQYLFEDEKSDITIEKYMRDVRTFREYVGEYEISKNTVLSYKETLGDKYARRTNTNVLSRLRSKKITRGFLSLFKQYAQWYPCQRAILYYGRGVVFHTYRHRIKLPSAGLTIIPGPLSCSYLSLC